MADILEIIRNNGRYERQMFEGGYYFGANGFMKILTLQVYT